MTRLIAGCTKPLKEIDGGPWMTTLGPITTIALQKLAAPSSKLPSRFNAWQNRERWDLRTMSLLRDETGDAV